MIKLLKNRISARKCRQKKKEYFNSLEGKVSELEIELEKYKNMNKQNNSLDFMMQNLEAKESDVSRTEKSKIGNKKTEYKSIQNTILLELYKKNSESNYADWI